tara:strand:- start:5144 stop:6934 length:1791 start_codon:yes stop_codon:yes gene_type:complete
MKKKKIKNYFLTTTSIDQLFKKKNTRNFYLGYFCISDNCNLKNYNLKNVLQNHWGSKKTILKKYKYVEKVTNELFFDLTNFLNKIHGVEERNIYWKIIIYPWVVLYVTTLFDRWETISLLKKKIKNNSFETYEYDFERLNEISDYLEWLNFVKTDKFNNKIFNEIIKFRKIKKIQIIKKKINNLKVNKIRGQKLEGFNFELIDKFLGKIGIYFNNIFFDKVKYKLPDFLKLCLYTNQIPTKNFNTFNNLKFNNNYNSELRKTINPKTKKKNIFEKFLYEQIKYYLPKSYLESYNNYLNHDKRYLKKRLFIGSHSTVHDDRYKIFLARSKSIGSRYIFTDHGAGIHTTHDPMFNHFYEIADKVICPSKKLIKKKKNIFVGLDLFNKQKQLDYHQKNKILINFHEFWKYETRVPVTTPPFSEAVQNFQEFVKSLKNLNPQLKKNLKFRVKEINGLNSAKRFANEFGDKKIENKKFINYSSSIQESKIVLCFIPQTSYIECIYNNIPTVLIGNKEGFFDTNERLKLLRELKKNKMFFEKTSDVVKFLNHNFYKLDKWWNNKTLQDCRINILKNYYEVSNYSNSNMKKLIKNELRKIRTK